MPLYEHVYLARQDLSAQQADELTGQFKGVIEQLGGSVQKVEYWGVKSLTYRIRKNRKAHFTLLNIDAPPAALAEIERQERINEDVLRSLTIRVDSLEAGPSAMMRKVDRDDRREGTGATIAAAMTAGVIVIATPAAHAKRRAGHARNAAAVTMPS